MYGIKYKFSVLIALFAGFLFYFIDPELVPDKNSYINLVNEISSNNLIEYFFVFNYLELLSFFLFYLFSLVSIDAEILISLLVFSYTFILFNSVKQFNFVYISFLVIVFMIYPFDMWLNQIRSSFAVALFILYLTRCKSYFWLPLLGHIQIGIISFVYKYLTLSLQLKIILIIFSAIIFFNYFDVSNYYKLYFYFNSDNFESKVSIFVLIRFLIIFIFLLCMLFLEKSVTILKLTYLIMVFPLFFIYHDLPIYGRFISYFIFFEPFLFYKYGKLTKSIYFCHLLVFALFKMLNAFIN